MILKKKIIYSLDAGFFVSGVLLALFCNLPNADKDTRAILSLIFILFSYFLFPFVDEKKKDKLFAKFAVHFVIFLLTFVILLRSLQYYINEASSENVLFEIMAGLGILISISYVCYLVFSFIRTLLNMFSRIRKYSEKIGVQEKYKITLLVFEKVTALLAAATALAVSVVAFGESIKVFL